MYIAQEMAYGIYRLGTMNTTVLICVYHVYYLSAIAVLGSIKH